MPDPKSPDATTPPSAEDDAGAPAPPKRWERPQIQSGQLFEANSLACFKSGPTSEECTQSPPYKS